MKTKFLFDKSSASAGSNSQKSSANKETSESAMDLPFASSIVGYFQEMLGNIGGVLGTHVRSVIGSSDANWMTTMMSALSRNKYNIASGVGAALGNQLANSVLPDSEDLSSQQQNVNSADYLTRIPAARTISDSIASKLPSNLNQKIQNLIARMDTVVSSDDVMSKRLYSQKLIRTFLASIIDCGDDLLIGSSLDELLFQLMMLRANALNSPDDGLLPAHFATEILTSAKESQMDLDSVATDLLLRASKNRNFSPINFSS